MLIVGFKMFNSFIRNILVFLRIKKPILILMQGLPCSGKTTYANRFIAGNPSFHHVSYDDEVQEIADQYGKTYNELFKQGNKIYRNIAARNLRNKIQHLKNNKRDMIIDMTNCSYYARKDVLSNFIGTNYIKKIVVMPHISKQEFIDRDMLRYEELLRYGIEKCISVEVYESFAKDYSRPHKNEGFDEINFVKE